MKNLILGLVFFSTGIIGMGITHLSFSCANWSEFTPFLTHTNIMYYYVLSWTLFLLGLGISIYDIYLSNNNNPK